MPRLSTIDNFVFRTTLDAGDQDPEQPNYQGSTMVFVQTTAPTGWTKDTVSNNLMLRGVSGLVDAGGTLDFTTALTSRSLSGSVQYVGSLGATTLTTPQISAHNHPGIGATRRFISPTTATGPQTLYAVTGSFDPGTINGHPGTVSSHDHQLLGTVFSPVVYTTLNLAVKYVDVIFATRN